LFSHLDSEGQLHKVAEEVASERQVPDITEKAAKEGANQRRRRGN
jgi:hypothetical protein